MSVGVCVLILCPRILCCLNPARWSEADRWRLAPHPSLMALSFYDPNNDDMKFPLFWCLRESTHSFSIVESNGTFPFLVPLARSVIRMQRILMFLAITTPRVGALVEADLVSYESTVMRYSASTF